MNVFFIRRKKRELKGVGIKVATGEVNYSRMMIFPRKKSQRTEGIRGAKNVLLIMRGKRGIVD